MAEVIYPIPAAWLAERRAEAQARFAEQMRERVPFLRLIAEPDEPVREPSK